MLYHYYNELIDPHYFSDMEKARMNAAKRLFLGEMQHLTIHDALTVREKSLEELEAEELVKIRKERAHALVAEERAKRILEEGNADVGVILSGRPAKFTATVVKQESAQERQARRYQMCIDAGLAIPKTDYEPMPRGIGMLAKKEKITRQSFTEDVKAHIRRIQERP